MSECTCGAKPIASTDEVVEAEKSEALEEPIVEEDLDKQEDLYKDMEATLAKLKEVMAYLEEMGGEEKQEEAPEEEEEEEEEEEPEEEEKADEDEEETVAEKAENFTNPFPLLRNTELTYIRAGKQHQHLELTLLKQRPLIGTIRKNHGKSLTK